MITKINFSYTLARFITYFNVKSSQISVEAQYNIQLQKELIK